MFSYRARPNAQLGIVIGALLIGAGLMYLFDPRSGRRRRALLSGQVNRGLQQGRELAQKIRTDGTRAVRRAQGEVMNDLRSQESAESETRPEIVRH